MLSNLIRYTMFTTTTSVAQQDSRMQKTACLLLHVYNKADLPVVFQPNLLDQRLVSQQGNSALKHRVSIHS